MARIVIQDIKDSLNLESGQTFDIVNAITNSASDLFQQYVPLANANNVAEVGAGIMLTSTLQNEFVSSLVERISLVVLRNLSLSNPLKKFKKGKNILGRTIEEIYVDIVQENMYDPEDAETTLYKRTMPNVKTLFHERNRQSYYPATIQDDSLRSAFVSWGAFEGFLAQIVNSMYASAEKDEYEYTKLLIDNYYSKGLFTVIGINDPVDGTSATSFVKTVRAIAKKMSLPMGSRDYNAAAVTTYTDMSDMHLLIDADLEAEIDVDVLAKAFNMDRTTLLGNITIIDNFASAGLKAVLVDKDWFMIYDNLLQLESTRNSKGLFWNYFYHVWQTYSASRFSNAVAFATGALPSVTSVIVDPYVSSIKAGKTLQFTAYVRATDGKDHPVSWSVVGSTSSTSITGTTAIDSKGLLTIDSTQSGELMVKASVTRSDSTYQTTLSADATSSATTIDVVDGTQFKNGDLILIGTEPNAIAISSISGNVITLASGLTKAQTTGETVTKQDVIIGEALISVQ